MVEHSSGMCKALGSISCSIANQPTNKGELLGSSGTWGPGYGKRKDLCTDIVSASWRAGLRARSLGSFYRKKVRELQDYTLLRST